MMMSRRRVALVLASFACAVMLGPTAAPADPMPKKSSQADLAQAVDAFRQAMVAADGGKLTALASPDLRFGHSNGFEQSRAEFVSAVVEHKETFRSIELSERRTIVTGDTGIARHVFAADIVLDGQPIKVKLNCVEVWHKHHGKWLLLARQAYKPASPL